MGFYGNITNTAKTQFTFDRTYPNRKTMESRIATDEIYLGRYVLVEYDLTNKETLDTYNRVQMNSRGQFFVYPGSTSDTNRIRYVPLEEDGSRPDNIGHNAVTYGDLVYTENDSTKVQTFYKCTGSAGSDGQGGYYAAFSSIAVSENNYTQNYNIDMSVYGEGRGYDSTVWQKVYTQGTEKFVMIAELNTVVPTFDITADAPTMTPLTPHFDTNSTNVYYKIHWQPQWGMRIAQAEDGKSDMDTQWLRETYLPETGKTTKEYYDSATSTWKTYTSTQPPSAATNVPAAIYWNNAALSPQVDETRTDDDGLNKTVPGDNIVSVLPTGISGKTYPKHDGTSRLAEAPDIQEFKINLPVIGNIVSDAYDIIHGPYRNNSPADSLQGRLNFFKNMEENEVPVQSPNGYLVGSTVTGDDWINPAVNVSGEDEYHQDAITVTHLYNPVDDTTSTLDLTASGSGDTVDLYTPNVDEKGHVVGHDTKTVTLPNGFERVIIQGAASGKDINDQDALSGENELETFVLTSENTKDVYSIFNINKWIQLANKTDETTGKGYGIAHALSEQSAITVGNETVSPKFGETFNIPRFTTDNAGHIVSASNQVITLPTGSYTSAEQTSEATEVITSIDFDETTGALTSTKADSSTLKLVNYSGNEGAVQLENGETYNSALAKLQNRLNALDMEANESTTKIITSISQNDGQISVTRGNAGTLILTEYALGADSSDVAATDNLNQAFSKLQVQIHEEEKARQDAISALDVDTINTESYQVFETINETDGKISATKKNAGDLTLSGYSKNSGSDTAIDQSDTLNKALSKLEYRLDSEIQRVNDLDYTDPDATTNTFVSKVTQTDGKISVERAAAGSLLLTNYTLGDNGEKIASTDSINTAFAKLQTQINNVIGSEEIAQNFSNIKTISDWLNANDSNADQVIDSIATLNGDEATSGSVKNQIKTAIETLDSDKTVSSEGKYITGIHIVDGKLDSIDEETLPTYVSNVQADWNATEGEAVILNKPTNLVTTESTFTYSDDVTMTIAQLMAKVKELEDEIADLKNSNSDSGEEVTPTE